VYVKIFVAIQQVRAFTAQTVRKNLKKYTGGRWYRTAGGIKDPAASRRGL